jgi:hypothetical protein
MVVRAQQADIREARRIAAAIARIPEFMMQQKGFYAWEPGSYLWSMARPFHLALEDSYIRASWDGINALCRFNGISFDATGEEIRGGGLWYVYQLAQQLDAMMAWDRFKGRWLLGKEFSYPERPKNTPKMKEVSWPKRWNEKPPDLRR